jgi:hypothetical protein
MHAESAKNSTRTTDNLILIAIALATVIAHLIVGNRYGFHRDELQVLDDARHLAWGYVVYPPATPFFARLSLILFGTSIVGFRIFASLAEAIAVVVAGLMARELGGRRGAQIIAAVAGIPFCLAAGAVMQYVSFDYLAWVLTSYLMVRLLRSNDARWWLAISASIGFGFMAKYGMAFYLAGIIGGILLTDARRFFRSKWLYLGIALCVVICLPNLIWQMRHHYISLDFLHDIHARDVRIGRTKYFLPQQLEITTLAFPLAIAGLWFYFFAANGKRFRTLGWMYVIPLVIFIAAKGRAYYMAGAYPMLYAAGAVWGEQWLAGMRESWTRISVRTLAWIVLTADVALASAFFMPLAPVNTPWFKHASHVQGDFVEEFGWPELVETIAKVRNQLPPEQRAHTAVLVGNYGEAGAVDLYGPALGLPNAISGINSYWFNGYGDPPPQTLIVVGINQHFVDSNFTGCRLAAKVSNREGIENEETSHANIFICGPPQKGWSEFWKDFHYYG